MSGCRPTEDVETLLQLAAERYVLAEDVDLVVQLAAERYDAFAASLASSGTR